MTKPCIECAEVKPLSEYYAHPRMADGHLNKCKECCRRYASHRHRLKGGDAEWVEAERERGREKYHRLYAPEIKTYGRIYDEPYHIRHRDRVRKARHRWLANNPEKRAAHIAVGNAVRDGRLAKPDHCEECGAGGRIHGHHDDYSKPLDVRWLCPTCHMKEHRLGFGEQRAA